MSPTLPSDQVEELASFQRRHRAELLSLAFVGIEDAAGWRQRLGDLEAERAFALHRHRVGKLLQGHPDSLLIETGGETTLIAFSRPSDAVVVALRLQAPPDPTPAAPGAPRIPVRIGIHVGEVLVEGAHGTGTTCRLNGLEVDRCQGLMRLAGPGQILLTRPARDMARTALRASGELGDNAVRWLDHGWYDLRRFHEPMEICEVVGSTATPPPPPVDGPEAKRRLPGRSARGVPMSRRQLVAGATLIALLTGILLPAGGPLVNGSYDLAYLLKRPERPPPDAVLALMDEASHEAENQDPNGRWDRALHAQLIDRLTDYGAKAVVMDLHFTQPDRDRPESDRLLIDAARRNGRVLVGMDVRTPSTSNVNQEECVHPFDGLREVLLGSGPVRRTTGRSQKKGARAQFREFEDCPSLPRACLLALEVAADLPEPGGWLYHYASHTSDYSIERYSYTRVLREPLDPNPFADRVVFVGFDPRGLHSLTNTAKKDLWSTPYSAPLLGDAGQAPGVEIVATAYLNLKHRQILRRAPWHMEIPMLVATATLSVLGASRFGLLGGLGWGVVLALGIAWIGMASVWWTHVWFPWLIAIVQIPLAVGWTALVRIDGALATGWPPRRAKAPGPAANPRGTATSPPRRPSRQDSSGSSGTPGLEQAQAAAPPMEPSTPIFPRPPFSDPAAPSSAPVSKVPVIPDYELLPISGRGGNGEIGRGGYGEVWLCRSTVGVYRAVKVVRRGSFSRDRPYQDEFDGIRNYAPISFSHPSLLPIYHVGKRDALGYLFYVMELADDLNSGRDFDPATYQPRSLAHDLVAQGHLLLPECLDLVENLANGLDVLHSHHLVHRDIKPANVVFVNGVPKLADIGLVKAMLPEHARQTFVGTEGFVAPEGPGRPPADIFSLGMLLYTAAMGMDPSAFPELPEWMLDHPDRPAWFQLNDIILKACELDPKRRFPSAESFADALRALRLGLSAISMDGIVDPVGLVNRLCQPQDALCGWLMQRLGPEVRRELDAWPRSGSVPPEQSRALLLALNSLIAGRTLYEASRFEGRSLRRQTRYLADLNPTGWDLARLNKLLLEDAFPEHFRDAPLMPKQNASFASPQETPSTGSNSG